MSSGESYHRTLQDVQKVIAHAKLEEKDLKPLTQVIYFADKLEDYKLMELDSTVLASLQLGHSVVFRGVRGDKAVLCTNDRTYEVKEAETSNSLLLVPDLCWPDEINVKADVRKLEDKQILGVYNMYYELLLTKPRLLKLRSLLEQSFYCGKELEDDVQADKLYDTAALLMQVQASELELKKGLEEIGACNINGHWRLLQFDYHFRALSFFLNLIDENSWPITSIPQEETLHCLKDLLPEDILEHIFLQYTQPSDATDSLGDPLHSLKEDKVSRFLAEVLLRPAGKFNLNDFLQAWQQSVPEGVQTDLSQLDGLALTDLNSEPKVIWFYPETNLPENIHERIAALFKIREKWTLEQIEPYIKRLATKEMNVNALLTKHARASNVNGMRYYSARLGK